MALRNIPKDLQVKIKNYLQYNWQQKKDLKIEEKEVMDMLNDDLKGKLVVYLNGKILKNIAIFAEFPLDFLSNLTFIFQKESFTIDETIFNEGDQGSKLFFI